MQLVNPPHQRKVDRARGRSSLCAQQTRFGERSFQNIILQRQRSDLGVQPRHISLLYCRSRQPDGSIENPSIDRGLPPSPATIKRFVGRIATIDNIFRWLKLSDEPRTFLYGKGGSGKTTIAYEVAKSVSAEGANLRIYGDEKLDTVIFVSAKQTTLNVLTVDQIKRTFPWIIPIFRELGVQIVLALSYTISPRHTDEYYAQKTRELVAFKPDAIYVKDQGGLLTVDRVRTLLPAMIQNAAGVPIELHSHCTTGLAPLVYLEGLRLGVRTLHTAIPPLAQGSSQPSVLNVLRNARLMGFSARVNEELIEEAARRLTAIARQEKLPIGAPLEYDSAQYVHQVPGGVISNLKHQLAEMRLQDRLDEVLEESVHVRKDLGYPIMITPLSQFVVTQAAINIATGERYKHVIDELILFAQGAYGDDSGYSVMDQNLKDRLLSTQRAAELASRQKPNVTLQDLRAGLGGTAVSDEEFLLRYIMKGDQEIRTMRAAGRPKQYLNSALPLVRLLEELKKHRGVRYVSVQRHGESLVLENRSAA